MPKSPEPVRMELQRTERRLRIDWDDGHESAYSVRYLRGFCPCAHCQGHSKRGWTFQPVPDPEITRIEETGHYAVTIAYNDGHNTGIYSWDILRELCPCGDCRSARGGAHAMNAVPPGEVV